MRSNREVLRRFIALEGLDGAGTTTQTDLLCRRFRLAGMDTLATSEPTTGGIGRSIREVLSGSVSILPETVALLFAADRNEHVNGPSGIRSALAAGQVVLTDRYLVSSLAYQTVEGPWDFVESVNARFPLPEIVIFFDLPVESAIRRLSGRSRREIYEYTEFQELVYRNYLRCFDLYAQSEMTVLRFDGSQSQESIHDAIWSHPRIQSILEG